MKKILIFEDNFDLATYWKEAIEELGHSVVHVEEFASAVEQLENGDLDLVITDMLIRKDDQQLKPEGGLSLLSRINLSPRPRPRIIAISGAQPELNVLKFASTMKADSTLVKPVQIDELLRIATELLEAGRVQ